MDAADPFNPYIELGFGRPYDAFMSIQPAASDKSYRAELARLNKLNAMLTTAAGVGLGSTTAWDKLEAEAERVILEHIARLRPLGAQGSSEMRRWLSLANKIMRRRQQWAEKALEGAVNTGPSGPHRPTVSINTQVNTDARPTLPTRDEVMAEVRASLNQKD